MKTSILATVLLLVVTASCKKKGDDVSIPPNSWQHDTVTVTVVSSSRYQAGGYAALNFMSNTAQASQLSFSFYNAFPVRDGDFTITTGPQASDEIGIVYSQGASEAAASLSAGAVCKVQVDASGKISLWASHVAMKQLLFTGGDTSYYSFNLTEL